ncbi:hypothetical protein [Pantoea cypripedii]|uniref:hypothetical protein n=1 Tax=Pantoea cypripedii TaxID=55209 RepID=UPI001AE86030|nr:hypothetical protein [Pantoea cypripedii]
MIDMPLTYKKIQFEIKEISLDIIYSQEVVPGVLAHIRLTLLPMALYFGFYVACAFTDVFIQNIWLGLGLISLAFWVFLTIFVSGYRSLFSMLPADAFDKYEILKLYKKKVIIYYSIWLCFIVIGGLVSVFTMLNILPLVAMTLLSTIILSLLFHLDISRYQISSLFGALIAVKESISDD